MQGHGRITIFPYLFDIKDVHSLNDENLERLAGSLKSTEEEETRQEYDIPE